MPERLTEDQWKALLRRERDTFKLTIRGCSALEAEIDAHCEALFRVPVRGGMGSFGQAGRKAVIAEALGVLPSGLAPTLRKLYEIRNDFAHGDLDELDQERADQLLRTLDQAKVVTPPLAGLLARARPRDKLQNVLRVLMLAVHAGGRTSLRLKREGEQALVAEQAQALARFAKEIAPEGGP